MLDLTFASRTTHIFHQRFLEDGLPPDLSIAAFARFEREQYSAEQLARGRRAWQMRALDEYRSQVAFTELLSEMTDLGLSFDILGVAVRIVRDEARHVELCRRMVHALGGDDVIPGKPSWVRSNKTLPLRMRVLRTIVGSLCLGETISVRMLAAVRDNAVDPLARTALTCLAADESIHGRFGWAALEVMLPQLSKEERTDLEAALPRWCAVAEKVFTQSAHGGVDPRMPFGSLGREERARLFYASLEVDVLQRFDALGLTAHRRAVA